MLRRMILVGLTGGVATGKSTVAKMFKQCGAVVIDADQDHAAEHNMRLRASQQTPIDFSRRRTV